MTTTKMTTAEIETAAWAQAMSARSDLFARKNMGSYDGEVPTLAEMCRQKEAELRARPDIIECNEPEAAEGTDETEHDLTPEQLEGVSWAELDEARFEAVLAVLTGGPALPGDRRVMQSLAHHIDWTKVDAEQRAAVSAILRRA